MGDIQKVRAALIAGDFEEARRLLQPMLATPSAEVFYLLALASSTGEDALAHLKRAQEVDNRHEESMLLYSRLDRLHFEYTDRGYTHPDFEPKAQELLKQKRQDLAKIAPPRETDTYEMFWDCQFCGSQKNLGLTHRFCPTCGAPQNPDARYFPADDEKVAVYDHEHVGVDVTCPACSQLNSAASDFCGQCGSPLTDGAKAKLIESQTRAAGEKFESSGSRDVVKEKFEAEQRRVGNLPPEKAKGSDGGLSPVVLGIIALVVLGIGGLIFGFLNTNEAELRVTGHEWERTIAIEQYQNFSERNWRDSRPGGDNVSIQVGSCREEQRGTERVADGETCTTRRVDNGDGTFREVEECTTRYREVPVYDDKCTWIGQRWQNSRNATTSGNALRPEPAWAQVSLNCEGQRRINCERERERDERYTVFFVESDSDNDYQCNYDQSKWATFAVDSRWTGDIRMIGGLVCDSLTRAN